MNAIDNDNKLIQHELYLIPGVLSIGRASENDLQLEGDTVSLYHAKIVTYFHQSFIIDLDSSTGVFLNKQRIFKHTLNMEDELRIGNHSLIIKPPKSWFILDPASAAAINDQATLKTGQASR